MKYLLDNYIIHHIIRNHDYALRHFEEKRGAGIAMTAVTYLDTELSISRYKPNEIKRWGMVQKEFTVLDVIASDALRASNLAEQTMSNHHEALTAVAVALRKKLILAGVFSGDAGKEIADLQTEEWQKWGGKYLE